MTCETAAAPSSASLDASVRLWHLPTAQHLLTLEGHTGKVYSVAFSPDGKVLASGGKGTNGAGEVFLWRASSSPALVSYARQD